MTTFDIATTLNDAGWRSVYSAAGRWVPAEHRETLIQLLIRKAYGEARSQDAAAELAFFDAMTHTLTQLGKP